MRWGQADVISRGVRVHQQPCHMLLGGSVMQTEMHGSRTGHSGSRLAPISLERGSRDEELLSGALNQISSSKPLQKPFCLTNQHSLPALSYVDECRLHQLSVFVAV